MTEKRRQINTARFFWIFEPENYFVLSGKLASLRGESYFVIEGGKNIFLLIEWGISSFSYRGSYFLLPIGGGWAPTLAGFTLGAIAGAIAGCHCWVPLLGAIAGCHCWVPLLGAIAGCHCWVPLLGCHGWMPLLRAMAGCGVHVGCHCRVPCCVTCWGAIAGVPLLGAIAGVMAGCHCCVPWLDAEFTLGAIAGCHAGVPLLGAIAGVPWLAKKN